MVRYSAYKEAVLRNATEKATQIQKQIDNVVREGMLDFTLSCGLWLSRGADSRQSQQ